MMRRIQAATLIVAMLAVPLALVARGYACAAKECAMMCCRGHHAAAMKMDCGHAGTSGAAQCTMSCHSQPQMDYGLNCPLPPFQVHNGATLPMMPPARGVFVVTTVSDSAGHFPPPFNPPRA